MRPAVASAGADAIGRLEALGLGDAFDPRAAHAIVGAGLHRLAVPEGAGGLGSSMVEAAEVLAAVGAVDGSTGLGLAMQTHVIGGWRDSLDGSVPDGLLDRLYRAVVADDALVNNASTEEGGGSPARGAIPGTAARRDPDGTWRLTGEKTWTTWLPALTLAFVSARLDEPTDAPISNGETPAVQVGTFLVDLRGAGIQRRPAFEALGMRGSASGRLVLDGAVGELVLRRPVGAPDPRGAAPGAWFALAVAATYLGVGEGVRRDVVRWALARRPGDGSMAVADIPSVRLRLGRLDADLRAARLVVLAAAERWDRDRDAGEIPLAKLVATRSAVAATDEALRIAGGPGFLAGRLERAFRDARAGLINPPLEDVALGGFGAALVERERAAGP